MVEAALILPLLFLLIFGLVEFGRAYNAKVTLTHAAREGVRELALHNIPADAEERARNTATSLHEPNMDFFYGDRPGDTPGDFVDNCGVAGFPVKFTITYEFNYSIPFFSGDTLNLESSGVMRCSG